MRYVYKAAWSATSITSQMTTAKKDSGEGGAFLPSECYFFL